ncbi:MAG: hypothetical protein C4520_16010 [Candidatus Abyssobacteria bacterium SURF_5]|uniref:Uncharacterized protein n=1 Tax=Abyssobacteria bacterium (strain SURF_5) TaxID=2093360 RepID=A0A3A4NQ67_ABYX5|nr:MAG: hypothetical protein C4520_16010 [Candidatus Abyssubacteria bacterium SURF_5]
MTTVPGGKPEVKIGGWLKEGWQIFKSDVGMFLLASLIYNVIIGTCLGGLILYGPLTCGMCLMALDRMKGGKSDIRRFFKGFDLFSESFLAGFFFFLLVFVGLSLASALIGIIILLLAQVIFLFTFPLIADRRMQFTLFALVLILVHTAGYVLVLGWLITTPIAIAASAAAYRDMFGLAGFPPDQDIVSA